MSVRFSDYEEVHRELHRGDESSDVSQSNDVLNGSSFLLSDSIGGPTPHKHTHTHTHKARGVEREGKSFSGGQHTHSSGQHTHNSGQHTHNSGQHTHMHSHSHSHSPSKSGRVRAGEGREGCPGCVAVLRYQGQAAVQDGEQEAFALVTQTAHETQVGVLKAQMQHSQELMQAYACALDELKAEFYSAVGAKDASEGRERDILQALRAGLLSFNPRSYLWSVSAPALAAVEGQARLHPDSLSICQAPLRRVTDPHMLHLYPEYPGSAEIVDVHRTAPPEVIIHALEELSPGNVRRTLDVLAAHTHLLGTRVVRLINHVEKSSITHRLRMERYSQTLAFRSWRSNARHLKKVKQLGVHKWQTLQHYHALTRGIAEAHHAKRSREKRALLFRRWLAVLRARWGRTQRGRRLEQWRLAKQRQFLFRTWRFNYCLSKNTRENLAVARKRRLMRWWDRWRGNFFNKRAGSLDAKEASMEAARAAMQDQADAVEALRLRMKARLLANAVQMVEQQERMCVARHFMGWRTRSRTHTLERRHARGRLAGVVRAHHLRWTMLVKVAFVSWGQVSQFNQTLELLSSVRQRADNRRLLLLYYTTWQQKLKTARIEALYRKKVIDRLQLHFNNRTRMDCFNRWQLFTRAHKSVKRAIETKRRKMLTLAIHTWAAVTSEEVKGLLGSELADRESELLSTYHQVDSLTDAKKQLEQEVEEKEREMKKALRQVELYKAQAMGHIDVQGTLQSSIAEESILEESERELQQSRQSVVRPGSRLSASHFSPSERPDNGGAARRSTSRLSHRSFA